jgi:hypothetical protein
LLLYSSKPSLGVLQLAGHFTLSTRAHQVFWHHHHRAINDLDFDDDSPDPEKAAEQRAILASYESLKKAEADARAREEVKEKQLHQALNVSIQQAPTEEAGRCLFPKERQCLVAEHRALFAGIRMERRHKTEKRKREEGDDGAGPSSALNDGE